MTQDIQALLAQANAEVEESGIDLNEVVKGGGGRLLPEGYALGVFVEYVEYGKQPQEFNGKAKDPVLEYHTAFALVSQGYANDDGTPYVVRTYQTALHRNEKAGAFKQFKAMNWSGQFKSFAQMLGQAFLVKIKNVPKSKTDPTLVSRIDTAMFLPPIDQLSKQPYPVPPIPANLYKLFLWNRPTKEAWDSLFIEGTYEAKDGKPAASKNRIQETILAAVDFNGSPLHLLLGGGASLAQAPAVAPAGPVVAPAAVAPALTPALAVAPAAAAVAAPAVAVAPAVAAPAVAVAQPAQVAQPVAQVAAPLAQPAVAAVAAAPVVNPTVAPAVTLAGVPGSVVTPV